MKKYFLAAIILFSIQVSGFAQEKKTSDDTVKAGVTNPAASQKGDSEKKDKGKSAEDENDYGWRNRFAFMVGGGVSAVANTLYLEPAISKVNNSVIIEEADRLKPNLSLGIVYTPFVSTFTRHIDVKRNGKTVTDTLYTYAPRGFSIALFLNPISLSKLSEISLANTVDLGMGLGWRSGNFSIFGTVEFFSLRQPRQYFIDQYKGANKAYIVNGQTQTSISTSDNDVFRSKIATSFGIKIAYSLDFLKTYVKQSSDK